MKGCEKVEAKNEINKEAVDRNSEQNGHEKQAWLWIRDPDVKP